MGKTAALLTALVTACCSGGSGGDDGGGGVAAAGLSVQPSWGWSVDAEQGSTPAQSAQEYVLTNDGYTPLEWTASSTQPWIQLAPDGGQVAAGASVAIVATLDAPAVAALTPGYHAAELVFQAADAGASPLVVAVGLTVMAVQPKLWVSPFLGLSSTGAQGADVAPASKTYTLTNSSDEPLDWSVAFDDAWVSSPSPHQGTLPPDGTIEVEVALDAEQVAAFPIGLHFSVVRFLEGSTGVESAKRHVAVDVQPVVDPSGWTEFALEPGADSRTVYVSSSQGGDNADGLSPATPKKSLAAGKGLLRDGFPDRLLLKKGDSWNEGFGQWTKSGQSKTAPLLVSAYGSGPRPRVQPVAGQDAFAAYNGNTHDIALVDLHFVPQGPGGTGNAVAWLTGGGRLLVEGCLMEKFDMAVVLQGGGEMSVRRNVMADLSTSGMYVSDVAGLLIEENVIDRVGLANPTVFKHGIYLDNEGNTGMVVRGNIISSTSSHGLQLRPGGTAEDNLFVRTSIALQLGGGDSWQANPGGVHGVIRRNVILDGVNIDASNPRGWGLLFQNVASAWVEDNVIANAPEADYPRPIQLDAMTSGGKVHGVTLSRNVVRGWGGSTVHVLGASGAEVKAVALDGNDLQNTVDAAWVLEVEDDASEFSSSNNRFYSSALPIGAWCSLGGKASSFASYLLEVGDVTSTAVLVNYPMPSASLSAYNAFLGGAASHDAFMAEAREQSKDDWRPEYTAAFVNDMFRAAFGK